MNESIGMAGIPVAAFSELRDGAIFMAVIQEETVVRCIKFTLTELVSSRFGNKWVQPIPGVQSITTLFRGIARKMGAKGRLIEPIFARSIKSDGEASLCFMVGRRVIPPAR